MLPPRKHRYDLRYQWAYRTAAETWSASYNGENRPVRFENAGTQTVVECGYDSQGRRFFKKVTVAGTVTLHERYVYDGYLQIAAFDVSTDSAGTESYALKRVVFWDPTEPTATPHSRVLRFENGRRNG